MLVLSVALAVVLLANDWGILTPDTKPEIFLAPWETATRFAATWLETSALGAGNFNVGVAPVAAVLGLLELPGTPAWLAMRVWKLALLLLAGWGARRLYRDLTSGSSADMAAARVAASVVYVANPYVIVGGGTTPTLLPYALTPWLALTTLRAVRGGSWRTAAPAALVVIASSGLNAGVATAFSLLVLGPVALHAAVVERHRVRAILVAALRIGTLVTAMSAYWLVPALSAVSLGEGIAATTESLEAINSTNSGAEVLRGLGFWPLYGGDATGAFVPSHRVFVESTIVGVLSFGWPVLAVVGARLSRHPARLLAAASVVVGVVVMLGSFPANDPTPWGRLSAWLLESVPGALALRTTNKAGPVPWVGLAILVGLGAAALPGAVRSAAARRRRARVRGARTVWRVATVVSGAGLVAVAAASTAPAFTGDLYPVRMRIPAYWEQVAADVNARPGAGRVLTVPGVDLSRYTWGYTGPDELGGSLFQRPSTHRSTTPAGSVFAGELTAAVDQRLQSGPLPSGTVSALARHLGAGDVVGRYDLVGLGPTGTLVDRTLADDPGLEGSRAFGPAQPDGGPGVAVRVSSVPGIGTERGASARPAEQTLVLDGAGGVLPELVSAGLSDRGRPSVLAGTLTDEALHDTLVAGGRIVLTDGNRRQEWGSHSPVATGPLMGAAEQPVSTRAVLGPAEQTVRVVRGNATVRAFGAPMAFGPFPTEDPYRAFDGDRTTSWRFGNAGSWAGRGLAVHLSATLPVGIVSVQVVNDGGNAITRVRVTARGAGTERSSEVVVEPWATFPATVDLGGVPAREVLVEVVGATTPNIGPLGISEVELPGVVIAASARTPRALPEELAGWTGDRARLLAETPVDVLLNRRTAGLGGDVAEARLERMFSLPDYRSYDISGVVRLSASASDETIDDLAGLSRAVRATATSRAFGNPDVRAGAALDSVGEAPDLSTGWVPEDPVVGESVAIDFPDRRVESFTVTQRSDGSHATAALVSLDDGDPFPVALGPGTTEVRVPEPRSASRVRILLTAREGPGFVQLLDVGGLPRPVQTLGDDAEPCLTVGGLDGRDLRVRLSDATADLGSGAAVPFVGCNGSEPLGRGEHTLTGVADYALDDLRLLDARPSARRPVAAAAGLEAADVSHPGPGRVVLRLTRDCDPCWVTTGQGWDSRWTGSVSGRDLGAPAVVNGYAAGWLVSAPRGALVTGTYGPLAPSLAAWAVSLAGVAASILLLRSAPHGTKERGATSLRRLARRPVRAGDPPATVILSRGEVEHARGQHRSARGHIVAVLCAAVVAGLVGGWIVGAASLVVGAALGGRQRGPGVLDVAVLTAVLVPVAWVAGSEVPMSNAALRVQDNVLAHDVALLAVALLGLGVWLATETRRPTMTRTSRPVTVEEGFR